MFFPWCPCGLDTPTAERGSLTTFDMHNGSFFCSLQQVVKCTLVLELQVWCCLQFHVCSLGLQRPGGSGHRGRGRLGGGSWLGLFPLVLLGNIWNISRWAVFEHLGYWMLSHGLLKILRRPCGTSNNIVGISWLNEAAKRWGWEIMGWFVFIHPTGCTSGWTIPSNVRHMLNICWIPDFHLTLLHNEDLGDVFEAFVDPFHLGGHGGKQKPNPTTPWVNG